MCAIELQYPLGSYSIDNPPSNETLKSDLTTVQTAVNASEEAISLKLDSSYLDTDGALAANSDSKIATQKAVNTKLATEKSDLTKFSNLYAHQGFLLNGKIVPSVTSNNLTVAIKTLAGTDPSSTNPVYIRIGDTVRTISAALSVTKNAATNWFNAGSAELATKEIDYFVYLGYNATDGVTIGFSRIVGNQYSDFSVTTTNEKYCAISTITNAAATDYYEVVGRFAATLSAGAGYTWSVPTFTAINLIQRPIFETRFLAYTPTLTGFSPTPTGNIGYYQVISNRINLDFYQPNSGTSNATTFTITIPFTSATVSYWGWKWIVSLVMDNSATQTTPGEAELGSNSAIVSFYKNTAEATWTSSGAKRVYRLQGTYVI